MKMNRYIDSKVGNYSKGMKQKLMLLIALANQPELILMDEPLNGLDTESIYIIKCIIREIVEQYHTAFIVTSHDRYFIDEMCSTKYVITEGGKLQEKKGDMPSEKKIIMYLSLNNVTESNKISQIAQMIDKERALYRVEFFANDAELYMEISNGIRSGCVKVVGLQ